MSVSIAFENLTLGYERHPAVHHLSGSVDRGALLAIVGPNGAGKSTLLKGIAGLLNPLSGALKLNACKPRDIAYLPQQADIDRSFPITLREFVALGLWRQAGAFGRIGQDRHARTDRAISSVGLEGFEARPIGTLSGGQMQRTLFARLLLQDAPVILLDEPFTAIDAGTTSDLLAIVRRWHDEQRTVIAVLHDMDVVHQHFPEALLIAREQVAWGPAADTLAPENLLKARGMAEAWDDHADWCHRGVVHA